MVFVVLRLLNLGNSYVPYYYAYYYVSVIQNQRTARINFKNLSSFYKGGLQYLVEGIFEKEGLPIGDVSKVIRKIEKGA